MSCLRDCEPLLPDIVPTRKEDGNARARRRYAAKAHGKFAGLGGMRNVEGQVGLVRQRGALCDDADRSRVSTGGGRPLDRGSARSADAAPALERRPKPEDQPNQCDDRAAQHLAVTLKRAEPQAPKSRSRMDAQRDIGRDRAEGKQGGHQDDQLGAVFCRCKERRNAFDHRRRSEDQQHRGARGRFVAVNVQWRLGREPGEDSVSGRRYVVVPMRMGYAAIVPVDVDVTGQQCGVAVQRNV